MGTIGKIALMLVLCLPCLGQSRKALMIAPRMAATTPPERLWPNVTNGLTVWLDVTNLIALGYTNGQNAPTLTNLCRPIPCGTNWTSASGKIHEFGTGDWCLSGGASGAYDDANEWQYELTSLTNGTFAIRMKYYSSSIVMWWSSAYIPAVCEGKMAEVQATGGSFVFDWAGYAGSFRVSATIPSAMLGTWVNLFCVRSNATVALYTNGVLMASAAANQTLATTSICRPRVVDGFNGTNVVSWKRILIYSNALTTSDISSLNSWMSAAP